MIGGQIEHRHGAGELVEPELRGRFLARFLRGAPRDEIAQLKRAPEVGGRAAGESVVGGGQFIEEHRVRRAVAGEMMEREQQQVLALAKRGERGAHQRRAGEIEERGFAPGKELADGGLAGAVEGGEVADFQVDRALGEDLLEIAVRGDERAKAPRGDRPGTGAIGAGLRYWRGREARG